VPCSCGRSGCRTGTAPSAAICSWSRTTASRGGCASGWWRTSLDRLRGAGELDRLVASLARYAERTKVVDLAEELRADWAREWGLPLVCERLLDELGVEEVLRRALAGRRIRAPLADAVLALVCSRISEPCSKLGCDRRLERAHHARFSALELQHLHRACDLLAGCKGELELAL